MYKLTREDFEKFLSLVEDEIIFHKEQGDLEAAQASEAYYSYLRDEYGHTWTDNDDNPRETLTTNFLRETSDDELKALYDNYGTLRELLRTYVQAYQDDLSHDVYARDFFGESVIKASGLEDTLPYANEWDDDDE